MTLNYITGSSTKDLKFPEGHIYQMGGNNFWLYKIYQLVRMENSVISSINKKVLRI